MEDIDIQVSKLRMRDLECDALLKQVIAKFRAAKIDSIVCRMPARLMPKYLRTVVENKGLVLIARVGDNIAGFLIFVTDNNVTLEFMRKHKFAIACGLLLSTSFYDKLLLFQMLASYILILGRDLPPEFENEISLLAVSGPFQGKGIGTALVNAVRQEGVPQIRVKTDVSNRMAAKFYAKNGFVLLGPIKLGTRTLLMFKDAAPAPRD